MTTVSIVIPCFNQAHYIGRAVSSALAQTLADIDVWVVDDGSTDEPERALAAFHDARLHVVRQENAGVAHARNHAIARSSGRFLHFLDADDAIDPDMLETLVGVLTADPDADLAYCDIQHVDSTDQPLDDFSVGRSRDVLEGDLLPSLLLGGYFPPVAAVVSRRALDRTGGFVQAFGGCCDWHLWARIAACGFKARYVDRRLARYRLHDASMSRDAQHMSSTMRSALEDVTRQFPTEIADAIDALILQSGKLFVGQQQAAATVDRLSTDLAWHQDQIGMHREALAGSREQVERVEQALAQALQDRATEARAHLDAMAKCHDDYAHQERALAKILADRATEAEAHRVALAKCRDDYAHQEQAHAQRFEFDRIRLEDAHRDLAATRQEIERIQARLSAEERARADAQAEIAAYRGDLSTLARQRVIRLMKFFHLVQWPKERSK